MDNDELYSLLKEENKEQNTRFDRFCARVDGKLDKVTEQLRDMNGRSRINAWNIKAIWSIFAGAWAVLLIWIKAKF
jgi:hypothetical protein